MKKLYACLLLQTIFMFVCIPIHSFSSEGFLWKITGKQLESPSFILGTENTTSIDFLEEIEGFQACWDNVSQVVTTYSIPMDENWDEGQIIDFLGKYANRKDLGCIFMDEGTTYGKLYSSEQIAFIESMITRYTPPLSDIKVVPLYLWYFFFKERKSQN